MICGTLCTNMGYNCKLFLTSLEMSKFMCYNFFKHCDQESKSLS